jgi:hypothetical protein
MRSTRGGFAGNPCRLDACQTRRRSPHPASKEGTQALAMGARVPGLGIIEALGDVSATRQAMLSRKIAELAFQRNGAQAERECS